MNNGLTTPFVLSFTSDGAGDLLAGTYFGGGVFRSSDNGESWIEENHGLSATDVRALAVNAENDIFAGTYGIGIFRSTDGGVSWEKVNHGLLAQDISRLTDRSATEISLPGLIS